MGNKDNKIETAIKRAQMAELVDALVLEASTFWCGGSSPLLGTNDRSKLFFFTDHDFDFAMVVETDRRVFAFGSH